VSELVTVLAIVTPAAVTVTGLRYGATREDKRIEEQRRGEVQKEIGDVLDGGAQALTEGLIAFESRRAKANDPVETGRAFAERLREASRFDQRITIRLGGEHATAQAYAAAVRQLEEMSKFVYEAHGEPLDPDEAGALIARFGEARTAFLARAFEYRSAA
jgi:hypothetical protein